MPAVAQLLLILCTYVCEALVGVRNYGGRWEDAGKEESRGSCPSWNLPLVAGIKAKQVGGARAPSLCLPGRERGPHTLSCSDTWCTLGATVLAVVQPLMCKVLLMSNLFPR